jgi:hypothetical protein
MLMLRMCGALCPCISSRYGFSSAESISCKISFDFLLYKISCL